MKTLALILCLFVASSGTFAVQQWIDSNIGGTKPTEDALYLPQPNLLRRISFGYQSLIADLYWLRTVQYYGSKRRDGARENYDLLEPLLRITTGLDPHMILVFRFGAIFLSEPQPIGAGDPDSALQLLDEGIRKNPDAWQLVFDKGFIYFWQLRDYKQAAEWFLRGSRHPGAPPWLGGLAAFASEKGGDLETAKFLWTKQYDESNNDRMKANALDHLRSIRVDEDLWTLEFLLNRFYARKGTYPQWWRDLIQAGLLTDIPLDPEGLPYVLDDNGTSAKLSPESSIKRFALSSDVKDQFLDRLAANWK